MADKQLGLLMLKVLFIAAFIQVIFSQTLTSNSIEIAASSINESTVEVIYSKNGSSVPSNTTVSSTSILILSLHPGTLYNITAANLKNITQTWVLSTRPLPPTNVTKNAIEAGYAIELEFNNQTSGGDQWLIRYKISTDTNYTEHTSATKEVVLNKLMNGAKYDVKIWTIANNVTSEAPFTTFFYTFPLPPTIVDVRDITTNSVTIEWKLNSTYSLGREWLIQYKIEGSENIKKEARTGKKNIELNPLLDGEKYEVKIWTISNNLRSKSVSNASFVTIPLPPTNVDVRDITTNSVTIEWKSDSTSPVGRKWLIQYNIEGSANYKNETSTEKIIQLNSLEDGEKYEVKIWTISYNFESKSFSHASFVTIPDQLSNSSVETNERNITVTWTKRKSNFTYTVCLTGVLCAENESIDNFTFTNLLAGKLYNVSIIVHAYGKNSSEYIISEVLPPLPPVLLEKNITNSTLFIKWYLDSNISVASHWNISYMTDKISETADTNGTNITLQLLSGNAYEIQIWSISLGVPSKSNLNFNVFTAPEKVENLTVEEIDSKLRVSWLPPQNSQITSYNITYTESCLRYAMNTFENKTNDTLYTFPIKPGCYYKITIWAYNNAKGRPAYFLIRTKSYAPPVENSPDNIRKASVTTKSLTVTLKSNPFDETNGPIVDYTIIVATNKDEKYVKHRKLPTWKDFKNNGSIKAYQIFENCNSLYERSHSCSNLKSKSKRSLNNVIEHNVGTENCGNVEDYCNGPLEPDTEYYIKIRALTYDSYTDTDYSSAMKTEAEAMAGYLIAIIVLIVLLIIVVIIGIVLFMVRRRQAKPKPVIAANTPYLMQPTSHPVTVMDFETHFVQMSADSDYRFAEEYESLKEVGKQNTILTAHLPSNRIKNRFVNILPYDFSRVKLCISDDAEEGSDYINANYIPGVNSRREYIATQGPLSSTRDDFWHMIWEQNVHNIVMLANCIEKYREKCNHYWPDTEDARSYGNVTVEKLNETITSDWTITEFLVSNKDHIARHLHHFHFTSWPDFGVPGSPQAIVMFVRLVRRKLQNIGPIVIHCSAGVGRSGTFIAVDRSLQDMAKNNEVDILRVVHEMRQYRSFMVQTEEQYIYIHRCILYAIKGENKDIYENDTYINEDIYQNPNEGHVNKAFLYEK